MGILGGRVVSAERLESEIGFAGKSFTGSLGEVGGSSFGGGGSLGPIAFRPCFTAFGAAFPLSDKAAQF